jgi:hypothetical protein
VKVVVAVLLFESVAETTIVKLPTYVAFGVPLKVISLEL